MNLYSINELYEFTPDVEAESFERLNPLTHERAMLEAELIDVRVSAQRSRVGIILWPGLYFRGVTAALEILTDVSKLSWSGDDYRRCRPWGVCSVDWEPVITDETYTLEIPGIMFFGALTVSAGRAEMYIGTIEGLEGDRVPDMSEESDAAIIAGFPQWSSVMTVHEHYRYPESERPRYTCRVCGYPNLQDLPVGPYSGRQDVSCPSCGFRFGHTDTERHYTYEQWRDLWVNRGMPWTSADTQSPAGWTPAQQIAKMTPTQPGCYICLVCGYPNLTKPYGDFFHPTYEICPCCGYQYGYNDYVCSPINWRTTWIEEGGMRWWAHGGPPENWDPHQQLKGSKPCPAQGTSTASSSTLCWRIFNQYKGLAGAAGPSIELHDTTRRWDGNDKIVSA